MLNIKYALQKIYFCYTENESDGPIPPISTKWAITSHPNSLNTITTMTYDIGNPVPGLGQAQICDEGIPTLHLVLDLQRQYKYLNKR